MALRPEMALGGGLATAGLAVALYSRALPPQTDLNVAKAGDVDAENARKQALWTSVAVVSGISLLAKDSTIFVTGGLVILALEWNARYAIWRDPLAKATGYLTREDQMIPTQEAAPDAYGPALTAV